MEKRNLIIGGGVFLLACLMFVYFVSSVQNSEVNEPKGYTQSDNISLASGATPQIDARPQYQGIPKETFAKLPKWQFDFAGVELDFRLSKMPLSKIDERYYLQPEFYPNFKTSGVNMILTYPTNEEAKYGLGTYPSEYVAVVEDGKEYTAYFLVYSSWGVVSYTGLSFNPVYLEAAQLSNTAFPDGEKAVYQNISYAKQHIQVVSITPNEVLLEPSYSKWDVAWDNEGRFKPTPAIPHFEKNWARKVEVKFKVSGLKAGKYHIGLDIAPPSQKNNEDWQWKYRALYQVGGAYSVGVPMFNLFIVKQ